MPGKKGILKIGLTGGIGAGKSVVARIFQTMDIPVYNADERAKYLMQNSPDLINKISTVFGEASYSNGNLNRSFLSKNVFNDQGRLKKLNSLVHPVVIKDYNQWTETQKNHPYAIKEAALLYEAGTYKDLDKTIVVFAPVELRIERVLLRDPDRTAEDVKKIIGNQMEGDKQKSMADFLIINDDTQLVIPQVLAIHEKILELISKES